MYTLSNAFAIRQSTAYSFMKAFLFALPGQLILKAQPVMLALISSDLSAVSINFETLDPLNSFKQSTSVLTHLVGCHQHIMC